MTDDRWPQVKALFQAAVERPIEDRDAFLDAATGDDEALRREVESLLSSDSSDDSFLDHLPVASASVLAGPLAAPPASIDGTLPVTGLTSGLRVGPYEIIALLGAGAMGEVYRACDTQLNREVALKVLPERFALDPDRLARFTREAQLLATLNHPNIAAIYGREESKGVQALVLELVEGPTLADRIALGPMPLDEALTIARQMAGALEAAHEKGIIHRDIKPSNIKIADSGVVKVLDFGLARVWDGAPQTDLSASPTLTATGLAGRTLLGTPIYMSPEQARGQSLDRRTDIWSFGCVLWEMLTGRAPFAGDTISDTLAAILEREPDQSKLPADTPLPIRRLLRRCLEKNRAARLDSAAGARLEIDDAIAPPAGETLAAAAAPSRRVTRVAIATLAAGMASAAVIVWALMRPAPAAPMPPSRFAIATPPAHPLNVSSSDRDLAISRDGRHLVYRAGGTVSTGSPLMVRAIGELAARPLAGHIHAYSPFFSPDGQWIGFFETGELKKVAITGGPAITLGPFTGAPLGAVWGDDNTIVFGTDDPDTGLWRMPATGGSPAVLTTTGAPKQPNDHAFPSVLPGGRGVLFTITAAGRADAQVAVLDLRTGQWKTLVRGASQAEYVDVSTASRRTPFAGAQQGGYLIYAATGALRAVRFDPVRLEVLGDPVTVVDNVMTKATGGANYVVSRAGTLVYMPGGPDAQAPLRSLVWVDRKGREEPTGAPSRSYGPPRLSPDGTRVAVGILDQGNNEIWILDLVRNTLRRLTISPGMDGLPHWTRDGRRIVFMSTRAGVPNVYIQSADGTGTAERLLTSTNAQWPTAITPDGTAVVGFEIGLGTDSDFGSVILLPLASRVSRPGLVVSPSRGGSIVGKLFEGAHADISPDGRYLAYQAFDEAGENQVYVRPFPHGDRGRWQISTKGGTRPAWARNGRELVYIDVSMTLIRVPVRTSGLTFSMGSPAKVFDTTYAQPNPARHYDVSPDGQRFLMVKASAPSDPNATPAGIVVVEHWFEELKRRVPTKAQ